MEASQKKVTKSAKAGLVFPVARFQRKLRDGNYSQRIGTGGAVFLAGVLEYLTAEIVELAGNAAKDYDRKRIIPRHIMLAIKKDAELSELLRNTTISNGGVMPYINPVLHSKNTKIKTQEQNIVATSSENF